MRHYDEISLIEMENIFKILKNSTRVRYIKRLYNNINKLLDINIDKQSKENSIILMENIIILIHNFNIAIKIYFNYAKNSTISQFKKNIDNISIKIISLFEYLILT